MTTASLLLLCALCVSTESSSKVTLKDILDNIFYLTEYHVKDKITFVDNVKHLTDSNNKCDKRFFCKVHTILEDPMVIRYQQSKILAIRNNLKQYNTLKGVNCSEVLKNVQAGDGSKIQVDTLKNLLKLCIQHENFYMIHNMTPVPSAASTPAE